MPNIPGGWELILILLVVVLVFGSKRLPESARSIGKSMRILKAETKGMHEDDAKSTTTAQVVAPASPPQPVVPCPPPVQSAPPDEYVQPVQHVQPVQQAVPVQQPAEVHVAPEQAPHRP